MIRLLVADDHPVVRRGLRDLFEEFGMTVVAEAATADEVIALAPVTPLDAVVLDLSMPGATGLEVVRRLAGDCPRVPVLVLSIHPEDQIAIAALKAGAAGYLAKSSAPEELVAAIHTIVAGGRYIGQRLAEQLLREAREPVSLPHERLSRREFEVLCRIAGGQTVSEIAAALALSVKTVSTYRARVLAKLALRTNAELMRYALERQLVPIEVEPHPRPGS